MEDFQIHRGWLEQSGALPPICLRTGQPTGGLVRKRKVVTAPAWVGIFVIFGAILYVILRMALGEQLTLHIPESPAARKQRRLTSAGAGLLSIAGVAVMIVGSGNEQGSIILLGFLMVIGAIALAIWNGQAHSVGMRVKHKDPTIKLKRVDSNTATELRRHMMPPPAGSTLPPPAALSGLY